MAEPSLARRTGFAGLALPGRYGRVIGQDRPVTIAERTNLAIAQIGAYRGKERELDDAVRASVGLETPKGPKRVVSEGLALIGIEPSEWLAIADGEKGRALLARLGASLSGFASFVDQTDARAVLRLTGPKARDVLAKGCAIDLDARAFKPQDAAITQIALIPCQLWSLDEAPSFELSVPLSYAGSFWSWLSASAAEYGYEVKPPLAG